ncbi:hypothetical protein Tco_1232274 [Tanacetum coccineum]
MVSRHQQNLGEGHWTAVKNILKYLRNSKDGFLVYGGEEELRVTGYCDASWQTDKDDSRSQPLWVFLLNGGAVTRKSLKQDTVVDSTCEFEYIASCEASKEAIWMKNFIGDLGVVPTVQDPIEIFCDNESAVALTKEPKDHYRKGMDHGNTCGIGLVDRRGMDHGLFRGYTINALIGLEAVVANIGKDEWTRKWEKLKEVEHFFEYGHPSQKSDAVDMIWRAVSKKVPVIKRRLHVAKRYSRFGKPKSKLVFPLPRNFTS